ncbi:MAG: HMA2 domain-containing protein [Pseudomonadota bacterium]
MTFAAQVVHQLPGRIRLRIAEKRKDTGFFEEARTKLLQYPDVDSVSTNDLTATLTVRHNIDAESLERLLGEELDLALVPATPAENRYSLAPVGAAVRAMDDEMRRATGGSADLRALLFLLLVGMAIRQIARGRIMIPAVSLLWYAFELVLRPSHEE